MSTQPDIQKKLEELFGADVVQLSTFIQSVATSTESEGLIIRKNLVAATPNQCFTTNPLLDVAGFFSTGSDGKTVFRLTDFLCPLPDGIFTQPINVVATPLSSTPCFLTVGHLLVNNGTDVEITVSTWDASGAAAPKVSFNWRCRVAHPHILLKAGGESACSCHLSNAKENCDA